MKIEGVLAIANKENLNGRVYSLEVLQDMVKQFEKNKPMFGELGMSGDSIVSLKNASHKITSMRIDGHILLGTIELLDTEAGKLAKNMFEDKTAVLRPRGIGIVNYKKEVTDYILISFDIINKDDDAFEGIL